MAPARSPVRKLARRIHDGHSRGPLSYLDMGRADAPAIVFIHGFGADLLTWYLCLVPLASSFRVIALDLPAHGASTTEVGDASLDAMLDWFEEALELLDVRAAHLVAHSMGAKIALGFALRHPEPSLSLGLVSPAGLGGHANHDALNAFIDAPTPELAEAFARRLTGPAAAHLLPAMTRALMETMSDSERRTALGHLLGRYQASALTCFQTNATFSAGDLLGLHCPLLILWGAHDDILPRPDMAQLPPHCQWVHLADAGHVPHMETPQAVVAALKSFLSAGVA
ncbi:alpha/beta fold hydrolase [Asticcacaulis sp. EMRT-3]|uniref:alpha/beta fold hydrolase n=1 Tax=Asticcacaulis sp. EMRT-3 TaxID=3040349 RepID=UPI0024AFB090|nr:alpha/beta fold hydrolase [Asticcacaulis sp. EMRT-3]MDI7776136.1 alpha/beta fold hydrolase [Asticcacaulis sp. EMRT-3]